MAIGITNAVDNLRLNLTVSQPVERHYLHVDDFNLLESVITEVLMDVCQLRDRARKNTFTFESDTATPARLQIFMERRTVCQAENGSCAKQRHDIGAAEQACL